MKNKILLRLLRNFAIVLSVFAVIAGFLFSVMFARHTADVTIRELRAKAASMADTFAYYLNNCQDGNCSGKCLRTYTNFAVESAMCDLYLLDRQGAVVQLEGIQAYETPRQVNTSEMIGQVFETAKPVEQIIFKDWLSRGCVTVGVPVFGADGQVRYVLILNRTADAAQHIRRDTLSMLGGCLVVSMLLAIIISLLLSRRFATPLNRMAETTKKIAEGNYRIKTGVTQHDEFGALAGHIEALALKLDAAENERHQLEKMRQDFFAEISHELRTPITVLKGNAELIQSGIIDSDEQRAACVQMNREIDHIQKLISDMTELTRLRNPQFSIDMEVINLPEVLSDAARAMAQQAADKGMDLVFENQCGIFPVRGDYGRLRQLIIILLDNAIKFSPKNSRVTLSARLNEQGCEVSVSDNGIGFDEETRAHIFERYFSKDLESGGSGLGLAIARQIVLRHQAEISCRSEVGKGSSFTILFAGCPMPETIDE